MEECYEKTFHLVNILHIEAIDNYLMIMSQAKLFSYIWLATIKMK
jgi:hypothetical protein